jgi:para-aminobenzoate synthetase component 1
MRSCNSFKIHHIEEFKRKLLFWSRRFEVFCYYDSNFPEIRQTKYSFSSFDVLIGIDKKTEMIVKDRDSFDSLKNYLNKVNDWVFGYFTYDLKNETENLYSRNPDHIELPELYFYQPEIVITIKENKVNILLNYESKIKPDDLIREIMNYRNDHNIQYDTIITVNNSLSRPDYVEKVRNIKKHIYRGDIYEMNFCHEFYSHCTIDPFSTFVDLTEISPTPFSCFCRFSNIYLLCASPERYMKKTGRKIISQPIKGTIRRGSNAEEDIKLKEILRTNKKERAENIMIVDLVRNDLSKMALRNSVKVEELCNIYTYKQLHQMISTISARINPEVHPVDIIKNTFPMGSMTGAPKVRAMELIEDFELTKRGLYSGSVGYFTPDLDFDFNVIIRSILYNQKNKYLSYMVGSAITANSDPEKEYKECLLKASALNSVLKHKQETYA